MAPYVRKSFAKHYKDGLIFIDEKNKNEIDNEILNMLKNSKEYSIDDEKYKKYSDDFYNIDYDDYYKTNAIGSFVHFKEKSFYNNMSL